jgi:2-amino-4-hydroxy-6-hydroxymethyldihydropteridine diphosphokinase
MIENRQLIIALGSNIHQEQNMRKAIDLLQEYFSGKMVFSRMMWTDPIGVESDKFLNCLAKVSTTMSLDAISRLLDNIEKSLHSTKEEHRQSIVKIDIDIIKYGRDRHHEKDWSRPYINTLYQELLRL